MFFAAAFAAHHAAQHISVSQVQTSEMVANLHHIFLVNHHTIGFFQLFLKYGMQVCYLFRIMMPLNISFHHTATGDSGTYDGTGCN
ncbi:hypothetical protein D3C86_998920 [compost metagenome]